MKRLAVLAVAGLVSVTASASNWVRVSPENLQGMHAYVDANSISYSGHYKKAFLKIIFDDVQTKSFGSYNSQIALLQFNCERQPKESQFLSTTVHLNGYVVDSHSGIPSHWMPVYPDSLLSNIANFVCSY